MRHPDPFAVRAVLGPHAVVARRAVTGEQGIALPPLHDHHVHSHLIDVGALPAGGISAVVDLGGDPVALVRRPKASMPRVAYAGAFLTAAGGYPAGRPWAPRSIVRELTGGRGLGRHGGVETAVDEQARFGASVIKISLNAAAGPVFDPDILAAVVAAANARALPIAAHVEGPGMAARAIDAGVDVFAHTPFSEVLDGSLIAAAARGTWISTLGIHRDSPADHATALANLAAFASAGGCVLYGTDLGNGDQPAGVNTRELRLLHEAGVSAGALIETLLDPWPLAVAPTGVATFVAGAPPASAEDVPEWLGGATVVPSEELIHDAG